MSSVTTFVCVFRGSRQGSSFVRLFLVALLLSASLADAQVATTSGDGVIDTSQYIAGPNQRPPRLKKPVRPPPSLGNSSSSPPAQVPSEKITPPTASSTVKSASSAAAPAPLLVPQGALRSGAPSPGGHHGKHPQKQGQKHSTGKPRKSAAQAPTPAGISATAAGFGKAPAQGSQLSPVGLSAAQPGVHSSAGQSLARGSEPAVQAPAVAAALAPTDSMVPTGVQAVSTPSEVPLASEAAAAAPPRQLRTGGMAPAPKPVSAAAAAAPAQAAFAAALAAGPSLSHIEAPATAASQAPAATPAQPQAASRKQAIDQQSMPMQPSATPPAQALSSQALAIPPAPSAELALAEAPAEAAQTVTNGVPMAARAVSVPTTTPPAFAPAPGPAQLAGAPAMAAASAPIPDQALGQPFAPAAAVPTMFGTPIPAPPSEAPAAGNLAQLAGIAAAAAVPAQAPVAEALQRMMAPIGAVEPAHAPAAELLSTPQPSAPQGATQPQLAPLAGQLHIGAGTQEKLGDNTAFIDTKPLTAGGADAPSSDGGLVTISLKNTGLATRLIRTEPHSAEAPLQLPSEAAPAVAPSYVEVMPAAATSLEPAVNKQLRAPSTYAPIEAATAVAPVAYSEGPATPLDVAQAPVPSPAESMAIPAYGPHDAIGPGSYPAVPMYASYHPAPAPYGSFQTAPAAYEAAPGPIGMPYAYNSLAEPPLQANHEFRAVRGLSRETSRIPGNSAPSIAPIPAPAPELGPAVLPAYAPSGVGAYPAGLKPSQYGGYTVAVSINGGQGHVRYAAAQQPALQPETAAASTAAAASGAGPAPAPAAAASPAHASAASTAGSASAPAPLSSGPSPVEAPIVAVQGLTHHSEAPSPASAAAEAPVPQSAPAVQLLQQRPEDLQMQPPAQATASPAPETPREHMSMPPTSALNEAGSRPGSVAPSPAAKKKGFGHSIGQASGFYHAVPAPEGAPSPGQAARSQLLNAAAPAAESFLSQHTDVISGYFDISPASAPCDGFYSVRARASPLSEAHAPSGIFHSRAPASR